MGLTLPGALGDIRDDPEHAAVFLDFDGTLAPIVHDPAAAAPLPGVGALLARLGGCLGRVVVVSGRPGRFLSDALGPPAGVELFGLYGMERVGSDGQVRVDQVAEPWRPIVDQARSLAANQAPPGVLVEAKGLTVTLHWRAVPSAEDWAVHFARRVASTEGLVAQPGRMSIELRPPVDTDKGTVVQEIGRFFRSACYFGDDVGDLPAFEALGRLAAQGVQVARVAVADPESPPEVLAAADVVVQGPGGAVELLEALVEGTDC